MKRKFNREQEYSQTEAKFNTKGNEKLKRTRARENFLHGRRGVDHNFLPFNLKRVSVYLTNYLDIGSQLLSCRIYI